MHWPPAVYIAFALGLLLGRWTAGQRSTRPPQAAGSPPWEAYPTPTASATAGEGPFQIWLAEPGRNKIATIKANRSVTHLGLREAKDLCESAPAPLLRVHSHGDADAVAQQFANVARLEIRALPF